MDDHQTTEDDLAEWVVLHGQAGEILAANRQWVLKCQNQQHEIERLRSILWKIAKRWPCDNADTMSRLAKETLGDG